MKSTNMLKSFRAKRNLNQEEFSEKHNISRQLYVSYENNLLACKLDTIFSIMNNLELSTIEIADFFNSLTKDFKSYAKNKIKK